MSYQDAFRRVEQAEDYLIDILQRMIAVDTSVPPGENYSELIDLVEPEFQKSGFETTRVIAEHLIWLELAAMEPIVTVGAAGAIRLDVRGIGKSCHSGMNYLGINAVEEMVPILNELLELKRKAEVRLSRIPTFPVPGCPFDKMTPMFNLTIIGGGTKENIVPGECRLTINRRYIVDERYEDVVAEIEEAVQKGRRQSKLEEVELKITHAYPPMECDPNLPAGQKARQARTAVHGYEDYIFGGVSGSTDLGFVIDALRPRQAQVAGFGLARASNLVAHAADEFVYVEDLVSMTKELVHYVAF